ncbi:hypothetical protein FB107DRAFT_211856 [Schizophyllum commune]
MADSSEPQQQARPKQKRHRPRLSCTNCTNRRQKCDRQHPCGLCIERNVQDTCEYLSVPYARPAPGRGSGSAESSTSQGLRARVAELEQEQTGLRDRNAVLEQENETLRAQLVDLRQQLMHAMAHAHASPRWSSSSQTPAASDFASPMFVVGAPDEDPQSKPREEPKPPPYMRPLDDDIYSISFVWAQRSLGHVGEFIGRGSILCALHSVSSKSTARMVYADSTKSVECPIDHPELHTLLQDIPSGHILDTLVNYFFERVNDRYGVPEGWFRHTYDHMQQERLAVNPNWLSLLFAILAAVPEDAPCLVTLRPYPHNTQIYSDQAQEACRLASAAYLKPVPTQESLRASAADGAVVRCFAKSLMSVYLAEHGHVSEAWKLTGSAIRLAVSVGMHRDPDWPLWQVMSAEEGALRRRSWWNLVILDRLYSYVLGRPQMVRIDLSDVKLPDELPSEPANAYMVRTGHLLRLCLIMGDAMEKCFSPSLVPGPAVYELDEKFKEWNARLPQHGEAATRHTLAVWYYAARMKLHHGFVTRGLPAQGGTLEKRRTYSAEESRRQCLESASKLIDCYCSKQEQDAAVPESVFLLYEATVTVISMMTQTPEEQRSQKYEQVVERAYTLFQNVAGQANQANGTPQLALWTLEKLVEDNCWRVPSGPVAAGGASDRGTSASSSPRHHGFVPHSGRDSYSQTPGSGLNMPPPPLPPPPLGQQSFEPGPSSYTNASFEHYALASQSRWSSPASYQSLSPGYPPPPLSYAPGPSLAGYPTPSSTLHHSPSSSSLHPSSSNLPHPPITSLHPPFPSPSSSAPSSSTAPPHGNDAPPPPDVLRGYPSR